MLIKIITIIFILYIIYKLFNYKEVRKEEEYIHLANQAHYGKHKDANVAIKNYMKLVNEGYIDYLFDIANIYHYGMPNIKPQPELAKNIYYKIIKYGDKEQCTTAKLKLCDLEYDKIDDTDDYYNPEIQDELPEYEEPNYDIPHYNEEREVIVTAYRTNPQNVHDSGIVKTIAKSVEKLEKITEIKDDTEDIVANVRKLILDSETEDIKKERAMSVLDRINDTNGYVSSMKMKEKDVLKLVWNRINQLKKEELKTTLINELSECVEHNTIVCTQGRASRLVDTLNIIDPEVRICDDTVLRQEMLMKASKIKDKKKIREELEKEYVDAGLISKEKFDIEINSWIDYI